MLFFYFQQKINFACVSTRYIRIQKLSLSVSENYFFSREIVMKTWYESKGKKSSRRSYTRFCLFLVPFLFLPPARAREQGTRKFPSLFLFLSEEEQITKANFVLFYIYTIEKKHFLLSFSSSSPTRHNVVYYLQ